MEISAWMLKHKGTLVPTTLQARHTFTDAKGQLYLDTVLFKCNLFFSRMICAGELIRFNPTENLKASTQAILNNNIRQIKTSNLCLNLITKVPV